MIEDAVTEVRRLHGTRDAAHDTLRELRDRLGIALDEMLAASPPDPTV